MFNYQKIATKLHFFSQEKILNNCFVQKMSLIIFRVFNTFCLQIIWKGSFKKIKVLQWNIWLFCALNKSTFAICWVCAEKIKMHWMNLEWIQNFSLFCLVVKPFLLVLNKNLYYWNTFCLIKITCVYEIAFDSMYRYNFVTPYRSSINVC